MSNAAGSYVKQECPTQRNNKMLRASMLTSVILLVHLLLLVLLVLVLILLRVLMLLSGRHFTLWPRNYLKSYAKCVPTEAAAATKSPRLQNTETVVMQKRNLAKP